MDKTKALELLKQALNEIPYLRELHHDNQDFVLWHDRVQNIIKATLDSEDLKRFASWRSVHIRDMFPDDVYQKDYLDGLTDYETALKSIIQKYEILGLEKKPADKEKAEVINNLPNKLFEKLQLHPRVVLASKSLFESGHYSLAIFEAFKAVNNFVKEKSGLSPSEIRGMKDRQLMAKVFDEKVPLIKLNDLSTDTDINEQEGFKFLFMGATVGIRNPKAHDSIIQKDPYKTLEYLAFASLLMKKIDFRKSE